MFRRSALSAVVLSLLLTPVALAGGWATTTLDQPVVELQAGQSYEIGYTVLQHGVTPVRDATPSIRARLASDLTYQVFPARAESKLGHYVATVSLPTAGDWTWEVDPHPFPIQPLGSIAVTASASATPPGCPSPA